MIKESFTYDRLSPAALQRENHSNGSFKKRHMILREEKSGTPLRGTIVEAHKDDISMAKVARALSNAGVELTIVTLTDGAARGLSGYTREELPDVRWKEGKAAGQLAGAKDLYGIDLPDGELRDHHADASTFLREVQKKTRGEFMIAPHLLDPHPDHAAAHEIALSVAGEEIPVYGMDTITGIDANGLPLVPDRYLVLPRRTARKEKQIYLAHTSQVENIPPYERRAMMDVLGMTKRRGQEIDVPHAAVLFDPLNTSRDPLTDVFVFKQN